MGVACCGEKVAVARCAILVLDAEKNSSSKVKGNVRCSSCYPKRIGRSSSEAGK